MYTVLSCLSGLRVTGQWRHLEKQASFRYDGSWKKK
jgi:hypothetical protein